MRDPAHLDDVPDYAKVVSLPAENRLGISLLFFFFKKGGKCAVHVGLPGGVYSSVQFNHNVFN